MPKMRMTYRTLAELILTRMTVEQQQSDLTIELLGEFYAVELKIAPDDDTLDKNHPYFSALTDEIGDRVDDVNLIAKELGLGE